MQNSFTKYMDRPIVQLNSKTDLRNIDKPLIYLCQNGQFSSTKSKRIGYNFIEDFIGGYLNDDSEAFSWKGVDRSSSFKDLTDKLFDYNYTDIDVGEYYDSDWIEYDLEMEFFTGYGFCLSSKMMSQNTSHLYLSSTQSITFFLVDPERQNKIKGFIGGNAKGLFKPNSNSMYDYFVFRLDITLHDSHIQEGTKCTDYAKKGSSYGECLQDAMQDELIKLYGCYPPWFLNDTGLTCEQDKEINIPNTKSKKKAIELTYMLVTGLDIEVLNKCLKPCLTMELQLRESHFGYLGKLARSTTLKRDLILHVTEMMELTNNINKDDNIHK